MALINFPKQDFEFYQQCPLDKLEDEVSRTSIRIKLSGQPQPGGDRVLYQAELDRFTVLKYINQLRRGKLAIDEFYGKVNLV